MIHYWFVLVDSRIIAGPMTEGKAEERLLIEEEYNPTAEVFLASITVPKSVDEEKQAIIQMYAANPTH